MHAVEGAARQRNKNKNKAALILTPATPDTPPLLHFIPFSRLASSLDYFLSTCLPSPNPLPHTTYSSILQHTTPSPSPLSQHRFLFSLPLIPNFISHRCHQLFLVSPNILSPDRAAPHSVCSLNRITHTPRLHPILSSPLFLLSIAQLPLFASHHYAHLRRYPNLASIH